MLYLKLFYFGMILEILSAFLPEQACYGPSCGR